jgi:hypothetical protein
MDINKGGEGELCELKTGAFATNMKLRDLEGGLSEALLHYFDSICVD